MAGRKSPSDANKVADAASRRGLWLNTIVLSVGFGLCCGTGLLLVTFLSLAITGADAGLFLNLLGVFMPGYSASVGGAWLGFLWAFLYAGLSGGIVYQVYVRTARGNAGWAIRLGHRESIVARLSGWALGLALGSLLALQLFLSSAWLIVRGTADESTHAILLANYLPGYSVTWGGAAVGAIWLFGYALALSMLFACIYNALAKLRSKGDRIDGKLS